MSKPCVFLSTSWWGEGNSLLLHFRGLAEEIALRDWSVVTLVTGNVGASAQNENPRVYDWPSERPTGVRDARFLSDLVRRYRPRCVIGNFAAVNLMLTIGTLLRVPHRIAYYHTLASQIDMDSGAIGLSNRVRRVRKLLIYRLATRLIPVSQAARLDLSKTYNVLESRCHVLYNTLAFDESPHLQPAREAGRIVCIGRLDRAKGQDTLLRAAEKLSSSFPNLTVDLIGKGPMETPLRNLVAKLRIEDRVSFTGEVSPTEVLQHLRRAAVSVVPSRTDNCPVVITESLAARAPLVASGVGGISEMVDDQREALLVPPDRPDLLADRLERLLLDDDLASSLADQGHLRFKQQFDSSSVIPAQVDWLLSEIS